MSYKFSSHSLTQLERVHPLLVKILKRVLETDDFKVRQGVRSEQEQWSLYRQQVTQLRPPKGKHLLRYDGKNHYGYAVDLEPFVNGKPIDTTPRGFSFGQAAQFAFFLRKVVEVGKEECLQWRYDHGEFYRLRLGINWDEDAEIITDQDFDDWFHVELVEEV